MFNFGAEIWCRDMAFCHTRIKRESGENPEQTRYCKFHTKRRGSDVPLVIELTEKAAEVETSQETCQVFGNFYY